MDIQRFFLLSVGMLFCIIGCTREPASVIMPDDVSSLMETMDVHEPVDTKTSFEQTLLPILTAKCALAGCHVENGPHGLDFRTYEAFIAGGEHGPAYIPGNAEGSEIVEQIVSGNMPPEGPPLPDEEIQLFVDWINQQEAQEGVVHHDHEDDGHDDQDDMDKHDDMGAHDDQGDDDHDDDNHDDDDDHDD